MELRIKPFPRNIFPKKGLLIKGSSALTWFHEMEFLNINLNEIQAFAIPSNEPNVLYGCFLIFKDLVPSEIGRNSYFQSVDDRLFIPENTIFYPKINPEDWRNINADFIIMHPDFGLVKLNEEIDWLSMIQNPVQSSDKIQKPLRGVKIPYEIKSFTVEMDDEKVLEALHAPQTEEEWMQNLPFDLKKVMSGNKKEFEKYLKYIDKYPDRALQLGVPLDVMGTSRGDGFGKFKFGNNWFGRWLGKSDNNDGKTSLAGRYSPLLWVFWAFFMIIGLIKFFSSFSNEKRENLGSVSNDGLTKTKRDTIFPVVAYQSGVTDINMKIDSMYGKRRRNLAKEQIDAAISLCKPGETAYNEYLENGGRPIEKIQSEIFELNDETEIAKDSLKRIYRKKITKYLADNESFIKNKIKDSIKKEGSGIPAEEGVVTTVLKKKKKLIEDSLGRLYGTKEAAELPFTQNQTQKTLSTEKPENNVENNISFSDIFWLIVGMTGVVGLYTLIAKRKALHIGGEGVSPAIKIFLMLILVALLAYIFYPLIRMFGYNWFVWLIIIAVILLLYRLFSEDKSILNSDKDE